MSCGTTTTTRQAAAKGRTQAAATRTSPARTQAKATKTAAATTRSSSYTGAQVLAYIKATYPFTPASTAAWDKAHPFTNSYTAAAHSTQCAAKTRTAATATYTNYTGAQVLAYIKATYPFKSASATTATKATKAQKAA